MKKVILFLFLSILASCRNQPGKVIPDGDPKDYDYVIGFGSCNNQNLSNPLWEPLALNEPDLFIWGGDIVYSDTEDMDLMRRAYEKLKKDPEYDRFRSNRLIMGTWDDHDYGLNDGGKEYPMKDSVQKILLDFLEVGQDDPRRQQKGVYHSKEIQSGNKKIKVIVLDTRYFRTPLKKDPSGKKRYVPNDDPGSTMLGESQWTWLGGQLKDSNADFHVIVSSVQLLSSEHGFETWGNMPQEVNRFFDLLSRTRPRGTIVLSGDRHIAEISSVELDELNYPLLDFTSSGMTHSYTSFKEEANPYRISQIVSEKNFGLLKFDFDSNSLTLEIRGEENALYVRHRLDFTK